VSEYEQEPEKLDLLRILTERIENTVIEYYYFNIMQVDSMNQ